MDEKLSQSRSGHATFFGPFGAQGSLWVSLARVGAPPGCILAASGTLLGPFGSPWAPFRLHFGRLGHPCGTNFRTFGRPFPIWSPGAPFRFHFGRWGVFLTYFFRIWVDFFIQTYFFRNPLRGAPADNTRHPRRKKTTVPGPGAGICRRQLRSAPGPLATRQSVSARFCPARFPYLALHLTSQITFFI